MKNLLFGLLAVGMAFSTSAFKNVEKNPPAGQFLVQTSSGTWVVRTSEPTASQCQGSETLQCYYKVTSAIPDEPSYSTSDINTYLGASKITSGTRSSAALYTGP